MVFACVRGRRRRAAAPGRRAGARGAGAAAGAAAPAAAPADRLRPAGRRARAAAAGRLRPRSCCSIVPCFEAQGGSSVIEPQTYLYYIQTASRAGRRRASGCRTTRRPRRRSATTSSGCGPPTSSTTCRSRSATTRSRTASSASVVIYNMEERQRVKIVDYVGLEEGRAVEDRREAEGERASQIRLDSFIDPGARPAGRGHRPRA